MLHVDNINSIFAVLNKIATECWDYRAKTPPSENHFAKQRAVSVITNHPLHAVLFQLDPDFNWTSYFLSEMYLKVSFRVLPNVVFAQQLSHSFELRSERAKTTLVRSVENQLRCL